MGNRRSDGGFPLRSKPCPNRGRMVAAKRNVEWGKISLLWRDFMSCAAVRGMSLRAAVSQGQMEPVNSSGQSGHGPIAPTIEIDRAEPHRGAPK